MSETLSISRRLRYAALAGLGAAVLFGCGNEQAETAPTRHYIDSENTFIDHTLGDTGSAEENFAAITINQGAAEIKFGPNASVSEVESTFSAGCQGDTLTSFNKDPKIKWTASKTESALRSYTNTLDFQGPVCDNSHFSNEYMQELPKTTSGILLPNNLASLDKSPLQITGRGLFNGKATSFAGSFKHGSVNFISARSRQPLATFTCEPGAGLGKESERHVPTQDAEKELRRLTFTFLDTAEICDQNGNFKRPFLIDVINAVQIQVNARSHAGN